MTQDTHWKLIYAGGTCVQQIMRVLFSKRVSLSCLRVLTLITVCTLLSAMLTLSGGTSKAFAQSAQPPTDWSFYITSASTGTAYNLGCNQGHFDAGHSPVISSEVILDFGEQYSSDGSGGVWLLSGL